MRPCVRLSLDPTTVSRDADTFVALDTRIPFDSRVALGGRTRLAGATIGSPCGIATLVTYMAGNNGGASLT